MNETELVQVNVTGGTPIRVEVTKLDQGGVSERNREVGIQAIPDLERVWEMISQVSGSIGDKLAKAKAKKAVIEFGVEIGLEAGQLTAMIVKGSGKANIKITLEWS